MAKKKQKRARRTRQTDTRRWGLYATLVILGAAVLRLAVNAMGWVPVHFDEAQYWAYGREMAAGHFSKPPLTGWLIQIATALGGDTGFALRLPSVAAHGVVAAMVYLLGRGVWDGRTGFYAAVGYTAAPGVSVSAMLMTTDPVMMAAWAGALYVWARAAEGERGWWFVLGLAIGVGLLAKYTMIAFVGGALGYGLFSARGREWRGTLIATLAALAVVGLNIHWQIEQGFPTFGHIAGDAMPVSPATDPVKVAEFVGAQLGVIGPVWFVAILALIWHRGWRGDWRMRMLAWQMFPLLIAMTALAFLTRAQPNWAAPAYVAGSLIAARIVIERKWGWALPVQAATGALAALALWAAAWLYAAQPLSLPRGPDPFKKMRLAEPFCAPALAAMAEEGAEALLSDDRRRLSECMFLGGFGFEETAIWNPEPWAENHHELVASLRPGDERVLVLASLDTASARRMAARFEEAREVEVGEVRTHADRGFGYAIWVVRGFRGY